MSLDVIVAFVAGVVEPPGTEDNEILVGPAVGMRAHPGPGEHVWLKVRSAPRLARFYWVLAATSLPWFAMGGVSVAMGIHCLKTKIQLGTAGTASGT